MNDAPPSEHPENVPPDSGRDVFEEMEHRTLGMWIFLGSLSMLFGATMAGYFVMVWLIGNRTEWVNAQGEVEKIPPMPDLPHLPFLLWASTAVILISSVTMQGALSSIRHEDQPGLARGVRMTFWLGVVFLFLQSICWVDWYVRAMDVALQHQAYRFAVTAFIVLSGLHALHVIGGLVPMWLVKRRAEAGRYTSHAHEGVRHVTLYWHFLDVIWLVMFASLLVFT